MHCICLLSVHISQLSLPIQKNFTTTRLPYGLHPANKFTSLCTLHTYSLTCLVLCKLLMQATPPCGQQAISDVHQEWAGIPSLVAGHSAFATASLSHLAGWKRKQAGRILYIQRIMPTNTKHSKSEASGLRRVCVSSELIAYIEEIVCEPHSQEIDTDDK